MSNFFTPVRMASQFVGSDLFTVMFQASSANAACKDGDIVVLGGFAKDPVYGAAFTAASGSSTDVIDFNTRIATAPAAATAVGVCVIDLANVATATNGSLVYRIGANTIGLTAEAGVPVRARKIRVDDTFQLGDGAFATAPTVGEYAVLTANSTKLTPAADAPSTAGAYFQIVKKDTITQGVNANVTGYTLLCVAN